MAKLEVVGLSKKFGTKTIFNSLNFFVNEGEFLSILGPSGSGKTTILRLLIGLDTPDSGYIFKDGLNITDLNPFKRKMGIVFQNYALFENMSVIGNVEYALLKSNETKKFYNKLTAEKKAKDILISVGLDGFFDYRISELSGGQQQRVAIARTLALNPEIILFDEPLSSLDVETRLTLREEIKDLQKKFNTTIIYITHDQEEAFSMSDRIMILDSNGVHQIDTPENIISNPADEFVTSFVIRNINKKIKSLIRFASIPVHKYSC